jgi:hypothetical protein
MRELSLNILDIAQNSVSANAKNINISIICEGGFLNLTVSDDGKGMSEEFLKTVTDPFSTTRTTRRVGLGIPLLKQAAEESGGELTITSQLGVGTTTKASFKLDSIDRAPLGDIASTITSLILTKPQIDYVLEMKLNGNGFKFCTKEVKEVLDGLPIEELEVIAFINSNINESMQESGMQGL